MTVITLNTEFCSFLKTLSVIYEMLKTFKAAGHKAESEHYCLFFFVFFWQTRWHFTGERAPSLVLFHTNQRPQNLKQNKRAVDRSTHHSQQHLSSSPSYRKYNTIFYKRTKEQNIYYLTGNSVQAKYVQQTWPQPTQGFVNTC